MTTECFIQDIEQVNVETSQTLESYEKNINTLLDAINYYRDLFDRLGMLLVQINLSTGNLTGNDDQVNEILKLSKEVIIKLRKLVAKAKRSPLFTGYKTSVLELTLAVDDFEEHIHDFKFRHDAEAQKKVNELLSSLSMSL